nr:TldD/PmbA family protein [Candidatus Njordarchaeum guaymaensis]
MSGNSDTVDLLELGEKLLRKAEKQRCDQLEVFLSREIMTSTEIEKGSLKKGEKLFDMGVSVRAVIGKSVGFAYASSLEKEDIQGVIEEAVTLAKIMTPDPDFQSIPRAESYPEVAKTVDERICSIEVEETVDMATWVSSAAQVDPRVYSINVSVDLISLDVAIVNSLGISVDDKHTYAGASASIVSKNESEMASGFEFQEAREIKQIDFDWVGREAAEQSIRSLGARKIHSGKLPVVFGPKVTAGILSSGIAVASNAENIQRKRSYLTGKLGEAIGSGEVTVIDDGTLRNGLATSKFDGEGSPTSKTIIIEKGVLKSHLHNSYTAIKEGARNTGNATRGGGWDYRAVPGIGHTNLILSPGKGDLNEFVSELKEGLLVLHTGDRPNLATGEFSAQATVGFKIVGGIAEYPVKQAMVGINLLELFKNIDAIGRDSRQISGVIAPSIRVSEATISGGT